jgi:hypothetical protein
LEDLVSSTEAEIAAAMSDARQAEADRAAAGLAAPSAAPPEPEEWESPWPPLRVTIEPPEAPEGPDEPQEPE